jgi:hypothetical protein
MPMNVFFSRVIHRPKSNAPSRAEPAPIDSRVGTMQTSLQTRLMTGLLAALAFAACGTEVVGSRYVKQQTVSASEGAIFTVNAAESPELNGTRLELPAGALVANTTVTVELGLTSILGAELAAGPSAVFGPAGTVFTTDVTLVLPVRELAPGDDVGIVGLAADGTSFEVDASQVALDATRTRATFRIRQLANYQPRRRAVCMADSDCVNGLRCVNGHCRTAPPSTGVDAGTTTGCAMSCPNGSSCEPMRQICVVTPTGCTNTMNCPTNFACVSGACVPPTTTSCGMGTACASGQACFNGVCIPVPTDGGSTNPNACMADSDCSMGLRCVNGACRSQCSAEACNNGIDDDCDGQVDEGCNTVDAGVVCGGFAGLECPMGLSCIDDPSDDCDPLMGGSDCGGLCVTSTATDGGSNTPIDAGSPNPGMCRSSADCMGTVCLNGVCQ